ncbi:hypothetical protein Xsze_03242 [Xenorhabdus szentirmaii DSM 16338]|nr:hypothetical protein Xsze_03242 [Xenorhabdus szentirmaii DSM 16338]
MKLDGGEGSVKTYAVAAAGWKISHAAIFVYIDYAKQIIINVAGQYCSFST